MSRHERSRYLGVALVVAGSMVWGAARADDLDDDHALSTDFETPHTDWAQPYARGTIRVLYFTSIPFSGVNYCKPRLMVELMQRFDVQAQAAYWARIADSRTWHWHGGAAGRRRILRLLQQRFDCYVFDRMPITHLATEAQYKVLKAVSEGAGLVLVGADDKRVLKGKNRLKDLPPFLASARPEAIFTVAKGRGVKMGPHPPTPYRVGWKVGYDLWQQRLGRAVLWAANRAPQVELSIGVDPTALGRAALPRNAVTVRWGRATPGHPLTFHVRLRSDNGKVVVPMPDQRRDAADGTFTCAVPVLPAGTYHADVRARSKRGMEAWACAPLAITCARTVESVKLDRDWGEIGEQIAGQVTLSGKPVARERLRIRLVDARGRILVRQESVPGDQPVRFRFPIHPWLPMLVRVEAAVLQGQAELTSDYRFVRVVKRHRGQFNFLCWEAPEGPLADYVEEALARLGVTVQLMWRNPPLELAAHDVAWVPYTTRIMSPHDKNGVMQPVCWNDEAKIDKYVRRVVEKWRPSRQHGVFVYSLGDEVVTRGSCVHPACMAAYRRYLRGQYKTIGALNASWNIHYATFDDVQLSTPDDNNEAQAKRDKNYPRWYDRQAFQCYNFVQLCKRFGRAYRAMDPKARTGFEGAGRFDKGDDYDLIVRTNGFWSPYPGLGDEIIRSIAPRDFPRSNWMGYTKDGDSLLAKYWRMITRGCDSVWWWMWPNIGRFNGLLRPTLSPYPAVREIVKDTQIVRDGLGTLLIHSEMLDDGIAILYSMPSAYAVGLDAGRSYGGYAASHRAWSRVIRELGLQYRYVTDRMLRRGEFDPKRYKVLVLARTEALGPAEVEAVRRFARGGGTVIADVRPAIYDGHCKALTPCRGTLDDLFGIKRTSATEAAWDKAAIAGMLAGQQVRVEWDTAACDPAVKAIDGKPLGKCGGAPLVVVRKAGKGRAVLLNFVVNLFPALGSAHTSEAAAQVFQQLFAAAGIRPVLKELGANGQRLRHVETVRWRNGDTDLVALFRDTGDPEQATVLLPRPRHVYDLRRRRYLGQVKSFGTGIVPRRATFFALTPEKVGSAKVTLAGKSARRGQVVKVSVSVPGAGGMRAVLMRAWKPDKQEAKSFRQVVTVGKAGATCCLPIAYNDPTGKWAVEAVELFTNKATAVPLHVK